MDLDAVDVGRFEVGRFGDLRLQKRGTPATMLFGALLAAQEDYAFCTVRATVKYRFQ
jgi:hypothetical protein